MHYVDANDDQTPLTSTPKQADLPKSKGKKRSQNVNQNKEKHPKSQLHVHILYN